MKRFISTVLISIFLINVFFISNCFASKDCTHVPKASSLKEVLYPSGGRAAWYFYKHNDPSGKALVDEINEEYLETNGDDKHACAVKHQTVFLGKSLDDLYIRYNWLHAAYDMSEGYVKGMNYTTLSNDEPSEDIANAIKALKYTRGALGSFSVSDKNLPDMGHWWTSDAAWAEFARSKEAFNDIIGHYYSQPVGDRLTDQFEKDLCDCIRKLKAAYDYRNKSDEYAKGVNIWDDFDTKSEYTSSQVIKYLEAYGKRCNVSDKSDELLKIWEKTIGKSADELLEEYDGKASTGVVDVEEAKKHEETPKIDPDKDTVYAQPKRISKEKGEFAADDVVNDADNFVNDPNSQSYVKTEELQSFSQNIYSILLGIGIVIAVIMGAIIGVKLMFAPLEERAEAKKLLIPYAVGCVLVFGAFGIWKLVITLLQGV